jgi:hypothetical protein
MAGAALQSITMMAEETLVESVQLSFAAQHGRIIEEKH